ncbi:hypothetical protein PtA15_16A392 [Puccinia triticina]|uniref:cAMP-dependent protein kinase n=1 Tax=Puccinia triticina TaxID=208348 RepID=A0ABY7D6T2_9BASI|nr:uncharacterized protein PtA15_16A392 [Puccinia triticina]WAQ92484.1 hypothetical protein PtA15_16A392 [Puccinia triticina]
MAPNKLSSFAFNQQPPPPNYYQLPPSPLSASTIFDSLELPSPASSADPSPPPGHPLKQHYHQQHPLLVRPPAQRIGPPAIHSAQSARFGPASIRIPPPLRQAGALQEELIAPILSAPSRLESKLCPHLDSPAYPPPPSLYPADHPSQQQHVFCQGKQFGLSLRDFRVVCTLGTGTFGKVLLVRLDRPLPPPDHRRPATEEQQQQGYYAIKVLAKAQVVRLKQVEHVNSEKDLLALVSSRAGCRLSQFFVSLMCTFQDHKNLYMLQEFVSGGELFSHLRRAGRFGADVARFYAANVVLAFEGLHELDIIYRDLKPENLLLGTNGYLKLTDFGFAKRVPDRTWTLCGTPEYLAPEIIQSKGHGKPADWWAFGVLIYEMLAGHPPFFNPDASLAAGPFAIYEKILQCSLHFSPSAAAFDPASIDLISRLLVVDRSKRLGNLKGGIHDIKAHPWFRGVDWALLALQAIPAPILPKVSQPGDSSNFDRYPHVLMDDLPGFLPSPPQAFPSRLDKYKRDSPSPTLPSYHPFSSPPLAPEDPFRIHCLEYAV